MDVMQKFKNEFLEERKDLLSKNHVYRNHINKLCEDIITKIAGLTLTMIETTYYPKDWNIKLEEDINKCINKSIAQNDYYCYV